MIKRFIKKDGSIIYMNGDAEGKLGYTYEKWKILADFKKQKPLNKCTSDELKQLVRDVLGKELSDKACKSCQRSAYVVKLDNYFQVAEKLLKVDAPQEPDEEKTPVETYTLQDGTILNVYADNSIEPALEDGNYEFKEDETKLVSIEDGKFNGIIDKQQPKEEKPKKKGGGKKK